MHRANVISSLMIREQFALSALTKFVQFTIQIYLD